MEMDMGNIAEVSYNPKFALITAAVFHARPFALVWIGWTLFQSTDSILNCTDVAVTRTSRYLPCVISLCKSLRIVRHPRYLGYLSIDANGCIRVITEQP